MVKILDILLKNKAILTKFASTAIRYGLAYLVGLGIQHLGQEFAPDLQKLSGDLEPFLTMLLVSLVLKAREAQAKTP
jgi:hypothetical protein